MKRKEYYHKLKQMEYLEQVNHRFEALRLAFIRFNEIWGKDSDFELDLNDYLVTMYPFNKSFNEFMIDFALWYGDGASKIVQAMREIQPRLSLKEVNELTDEVEEDEAEYKIDAIQWENIAEKRMAEIRRLREIISTRHGFDATFIKDVGTEQTGGGVMVDFVTFKELPFVLGISDDSVVLYKDRDSFCGDEEGILDAMSLHENNADYSRSPQTSMFTIEQMKGTGQMNILDQINQVEDIRKRLRVDGAVFWTDRQHSWLHAKFSELVLLDVHLIISKYSYRKGDDVYLEEDSDAIKYIKAIFGQEPEKDPLFELWRSQVREEYRNNIFIRKLKHYYK